VLHGTELSDLPGLKVQHPGSASTSPWCAASVTAPEGTGVSSQLLILWCLQLPPSPRTGQTFIVQATDSTQYLILPLCFPSQLLLHLLSKVFQSGRRTLFCLNAIIKGLTKVLSHVLPRKDVMLGCTWGLRRLGPCFLEDALIFLLKRTMSLLWGLGDLYLRHKGGALPALWNDQALLLQDNKPQLCVHQKWWQMWHRKNRVNKTRKCQREWQGHWVSCTHPTLLGSKLLFLHFDIWPQRHLVLLISTEKWYDWGDQNGGALVISHQYQMLTEMLQFHARDCFPGEVRNNCFPLEFGQG